MLIILAINYILIIKNIHRYVYVGFLFFSALPPRFLALSSRLPMTLGTDLYCWSFYLEPFTLVLGLRLARSHSSHLIDL